MAEGYKTVPVTTQAEVLQNVLMTFFPKTI